MASASTSGIGSGFSSVAWRTTVSAPPRAGQPPARVPAGEGRRRLRRVDLGVDGDRGSPRPARDSCRARLPHTRSPSWSRLPRHHPRGPPDHAAARHLADLVRDPRAHSGARDARPHGASRGTASFAATGDPTDRTRLTLETIRDVLAAVVEARSADDPHLQYLDGRELYGEADAARLPLPDQLHPDAETHRHDRRALRRAAPPTMSPMPGPPATDGRRTAAAARRRAREAEIVAATRQLFDEQRRPRGPHRRHRPRRRDQPGHRLPALHRQGGAVRADHGRLPRRAGRAARRRVGAQAATPETRLTAIVGAFVDYALAHPAFVDCAQALMRRPGQRAARRGLRARAAPAGRRDVGLPAQPLERHRGRRRGRRLPGRGRHPARQHALRQRPRRAAAGPLRPGDP